MVAATLPPARAVVVVAELPEAAVDAAMPPAVPSDKATAPPTVAAAPITPAALEVVEFPVSSAKKNGEDGDGGASSNNLIFFASSGAGCTVFDHFEVRTAGNIRQLCNLSARKAWESGMAVRNRRSRR